MSKRSFVAGVITSAVIGAGAAGNAYAEVEANCSSTMGGVVSCEFSNLGSKKDSVCVVVEVERAMDAKTYSYPSFGGKGAILTTNKICSGLVEPQDIRERKPEVTWNLAAGGGSVKPIDFCSTDNEWIKAAGGLCGMRTKKL